jgi:hypothetical protein
MYTTPLYFFFCLKTKKKTLFFINDVLGVDVYRF